MEKANFGDGAYSYFAEAAPRLRSSSDARAAEDTESVRRKFSALRKGLRGDTPRGGPYTTGLFHHVAYSGDSDEEL